MSLSYILENKWKEISGVKFQQAYQWPEPKEAPNEKKLEPHED